MPALLMCAMQVLVPCYTESLEIVKDTIIAAADALLPDKCKRTVLPLSAIAVSMRSPG